MNMRLILRALVFVNAIICCKNPSITNNAVPISWESAEPFIKSGAVIAIVIINHKLELKLSDGKILTINNTPPLPRDAEIQAFFNRLSPQPIPVTIVHVD